MRNDKTTLKDLYFIASQEQSVFDLLDHTTTQAGKEMLRKHVFSPPESFEQLASLQQTVKFFAAHPNAWTSFISNGTLVMLEKFFESADASSTPPGGISLNISAFFQKLFYRGQYTFTQFSISHLSDFLKGCRELAEIQKMPEVPASLKNILQEIEAELENHRLSEHVMSVTKWTSYKDLSRLSFLARRELKNPVYRLLHHFAKLDAWRSLALATINNNWIFPELSSSLPLKMKAEGLYHPLLKKPVSYDVQFDESRNFLLLTGANMSGKTTFMRTLGVSALLAHLGMGVPARSFQISFLQGIITNMHVEDSLIHGESYFLAEVMRIKQTVQNILQPLPHLVLMDELFKGTNVHDAYECTKAVVDGLLKHRHHILVLSTHLYEVAQHFKDRQDIIFSYFVTDMTHEGNYSFSYELKPGISNDRIGYRILQKEGVIELLQHNRN